MVKRPKFMEAHRLEVFISPKSRPKVDKEAGKVVQLYFVAKMTPEAALASDEILRRAYEDCEDLERKIDKVELRLEIENTEILLFQLDDSSAPVFLLEDIKLEELACERVEAVTWLYFSVCVPQHRKGFWDFYGQWYNHTLFAEFRPSQFALGVTIELEPLPQKPRGGKK